MVISQLKTKRAALWNIRMLSASGSGDKFILTNYPPASEASREVANLT